MSVSFPLTSSEYGLHFREEDGVYICEEIATLRDRLARPAIETAIEQVLAGLCEYDVSYDPTFKDPLRKRSARRYMEGCLDELRMEVAKRNFHPYDELLRWCSAWWQDRDGFDLLHFRRTYQKAVLKSIVLTDIKRILQPAHAYSQSEIEIGNGGFVALMGEQGNNRDRIVFDATGRFWHVRLGEFMYLQQQSNGLPLVRGAGGDRRAFFDGVRFMSLRGFSTCRHEARILCNGYILHADDCNTICNGKLYTMGYPEAQVAYIEDGQVLIGDKPVTPAGEFLPSKIRWDGTFPRVEYSQYVPTA